MTNSKNQKPADTGDEPEQLAVSPAENISSKVHTHFSLKSRTHQAEQDVTPAPEGRMVPVRAHPTASGRVTRATNKTNRPGLVDISPPTKKRRTGAELIQHKQEVANSKQARKDAATRATEIQKQQQQEVADMEDTIANQEESNRVHAARPPLGEILTKVSRPVSSMVS